MKTQLNITATSPAMCEDGSFGKAYYIEGAINEAINWTYEYRLRLQQATIQQTATPTDFTRYQEIQEQMRVMIREGKIHYQLFDDAFAEMVEIQNRHGGMPPEPPDMDALEQELVEAGVEKGLR